MPYILRDAFGKITKVTTQPVHGAEMVSYDNPEVQTFLSSGGQDPKDIDRALGELRRTDADMTRAVEDVITALLKKNVLKMTDLPKPVQERMALRVRLRVQIQEAFDRATMQHDRNSFADRNRFIEGDKPDEMF
jgi:hypothetical protein